MSQSDHGNDLLEEQVVPREQAKVPAPLKKISGSQGVPKTKGVFDAEDENAEMMTLETDPRPPRTRNCARMLFNN